ncbi:hypothetical protein ACWF94_39030 [Streptomyces sp. NPDC055078]
MSVQVPVAAVGARTRRSPPSVVSSAPAADVSVRTGRRRVRTYGRRRGPRTHGRRRGPPPVECAGHRSGHTARTAFGTPAVAGRRRHALGTERAHTGRPRKRPEHISTLGAGEHGPGRLTLHNSGYGVRTRPRQGLLDHAPAVVPMVPGLIG